MEEHLEEHLEQRLDLLARIMKQKRATTLTHAQYLAQNREYAPGENLYMREVHFVMAVGDFAGQGCTMSELAQNLAVTSGAVSQLATRLEKKGYVRRCQNEVDKRQIVAVLTPKGESLYALHSEYDRSRFQEIARHFSNFTDEQLLLCMEYEKAMQDIFEQAGQIDKAAKHKTP